MFLNIRRSQLLFMVAGILTAYFWKGPFHTSDLRSAVFNKAVVILVFFALYWNRHRIAALIEGLILATRVSFLADGWFWLEDLFGGSTRGAYDLPGLTGPPTVPTIVQPQKTPAKADASRTDIAMGLPVDEETKHRWTADVQQHKEHLAIFRAFRQQVYCCWSL